MSHPSATESQLPVVVIGAGPIGLTAAIHLLDRGLEPLVLEAGEGPGDSVRRWAHVRMFSPWKYNVDEIAKRQLLRHGWRPPADDHLPTGGELVRDYVEPMARLPQIASRLRYGHRVVAVSKLGMDRMRSSGRDEAPFEVRFAHAGGEGRVRARAVIDASGTWRTPNPLGAGGLPAEGESAVDGDPRIVRRIPDILGADRPRFAGRHVLVVGSGDSAFTALIELAELAETVPDTRISWAIRGTEPSWGGGVADRLPERGALGSRVRSLVQAGRVRLRSAFEVEAVEMDDDGVRLRGRDQTVEHAEVVIASTGFRPDHSLARELRLTLDPVTEAPGALGPLIDPNLHSCGTVPPHGVAELSHPDAGYTIVGMKSYGRAPTFLLMTGYEQVRSVVAALAGDWEAAREVRLVLPETGVCSTAV